MSTYLLNSISNLKNKYIESLTNSKTIDELLNYTNSNIILLNFLVDHTINELKDNKHFFNTNIEKLKIKDISFFDDYVGDKKELEETIKSNDIDSFFAIFKDELTSKIEDQSKNNTYELIGSYVDTINAISKKELINAEYMNIMANTINKIKGVDASTINAEEYLINKIKVFLASNPSDENKEILVKAHMKLFKKDSEGKYLADNRTNDEIISYFYENITFSDGKSRMVPEYSSLQKELINDGFSVRNADMSEHKSTFFSIINLKKELSKLENIKDYSLDDLKQFFEIVFLEKNDLSEYLRKPEKLKSIKKNEFLSTVDFSKLMLTDEEVREIGFVMNLSKEVLVPKPDKSKLSTLQDYIEYYSKDYSKLENSIKIVNEFVNSKGVSIQIEKSYQKDFESLVNIMKNVKSPELQDKMLGEFRERFKLDKSFSLDDLNFNLKDTCSISDSSYDLNKEKEELSNMDLNC